MLLGVTCVHLYLRRSDGLLNFLLLLFQGVVLTIIHGSNVAVSMEVSEVFLCVSATVAEILAFVAQPSHVELMVFGD